MNLLGQLQAGTDGLPDPAKMALCQPGCRRIL